MKNLYESSIIIRHFAKFLTWQSSVTGLIILFITFFIVSYNKKRSRLVRLIGKIPGPPSLPIIGNSIEINVDHDEVFARITGMRKLFGRKQGINKAWVGSKPYIFISKPSAVETILSSPKHIDKSADYKFLRPWLGTGLLTSYGKKWHTRRKILTPAFHFKILDDFIDVFHEQSLILVEKLKQETNKESFNVFPYVTLCTLDIVCETAMGRQINAQGNSDSDYVKAVYEIGKIVLNRQVKIWLQPQLIFRFTKHYTNHQKCLKILHEFSYRVIRERKQELLAQSANESNNNLREDKLETLKNKMKMDSNNNDDPSDSNNNDEFSSLIQSRSNINSKSNEIGAKKRLAFLDLLIAASENGKVLSDEDIREEVDTFMFEGHDTTSAAISWCLFLIGSHPDIQAKCFQEIDDVLGKDPEKVPTMKELSELKYLECCIKESLRLYPSVPLIARQLNEDVKIDDYTIPATTTVMVVTYMLHRNPDVYKHPEKFDPDRFIPENSCERHPYAYIPFSAGPRNCIGQKFAILEEKMVISHVLRSYKIEAVDRREDLTILGELILRPKKGLKIKITPRQSI